jgi:hypothetical protein
MAGIEGGILASVWPAECCGDPDGSVDRRVGSGSDRDTRDRTIGPREPRLRLIEWELDRVCGGEEKR